MPSWSSLATTDQKRVWRSSASEMSSMTSRGVQPLLCGQIEHPAADQVRPGAGLGHRDGLPVERDLLASSSAQAAALQAGSR